MLSPCSLTCSKNERSNSSVTKSWDTAPLESWILKMISTQILFKTHQVVQPSNSPWCHKCYQLGHIGRDPCHQNRSRSGEQIT